MLDFLDTLYMFIWISILLNENKQFGIFAFDKVLFEIMAPNVTSTELP